MAARGAKQALQHLQHGRTVMSATRASQALFSVSTASDIHPAATVEAEPIESKAVDRKKLLVLGGNGYVGTHVCKEALAKGFPVMSLSRSGRPGVHEPWSDSVNWVKGDLFHPEGWKDALEEASAVISCVGGFGSNDQMRKINGSANIQAIQAAAASGVKRFVYVSALNFGLPSFVLRGYYEGKRSAEEELLRKFPYGGVILRPGFIHGYRQVGSVKIPLNAIGAPLEMVLKNMKAASQIPVIGNFLLPPVKVTSVARAAVRSATDNAVPPGVLDVWGIMRIGDHS